MRAYLLGGCLSLVSAAYFHLLLIRRDRLPRLLEGAEPNVHLNQEQARPGPYRLEGHENISPEGLIKAREQRLAFADFLLPLPLRLEKLAAYLGLLSRIPKSHPEFFRGLRALFRILSNPRIEARRSALVTIRLEVLREVRLLLRELPDHHPLHREYFQTLGKTILNPRLQKKMVAGAS